MRLNQENLKELNKNLVSIDYNRSTLTSGIVHVGVGGFHRSHQAYFLHELMKKGEAKEWAICGIGLREGDRKIYEVLSAQDGLYTLVTQHGNGNIESEVIGSITNMMLAVDDAAAIIEKMADPGTKILSLTITEGGYNLNSATGEFDFSNSVIKQELENPSEPKTIFGYLAQALKLIKEKGRRPFTIMSCDNIQHNGNVTKKMVLSFLNKYDADLAEWVEQEVSFPNSMVDRITPITTPEIITYLKNNYDLEDEWPVVCEPFIQWVVEDNFCNGRPDLETVGVQFVDDVTPYENMKIRLLNAGHSVLGIPGAIKGHETIYKCMEDGVFSSFMRAFMDREVTPILAPVPGIDLEAYKDSLEERFSNPNIKDSVARICSESSSKLPKFLIPTLVENLEKGGSIEYATFVLAAWCYYSDVQKNEKGEPIEIIDEHKEKLHDAAQQSDELSFLNQEEIFGELIHNERFVKSYREMSGLIYSTKDIGQLMSDMLR